MALDPITAISDLIKTGLEKWIPDANVREKAAAELGMQVHAQTMAQIEVNKIEAASASLFVAGWRPAVGWVCVCAYAYEFVIQPFFMLGMSAIGHPVDQATLPELNMTELGGLLFAMLGIGGMRSFEKIKGVTK